MGRVAFRNIVMMPALEMIYRGFGFDYFSLRLAADPAEIVVKRVEAAAVNRLQRVHREKISRGGLPGHVGVAGGVNGDPVAKFERTTTQIGGVDKGRTGPFNFVTNASE